MTDRSIVVRLRADNTDYDRKMTGSAQKTKAWVDSNSANITKLSNSVGIVGAAMTGVAVLAVSKFAQFDSAMSNVAATGDDARGSLTGLRQAALDAGADTVFSATEAAGAIENLAKAGVSASDIMGGGLAGSLDLAAAGSLDVADAAEIAATAMTQFNLEGSDMTHVADLLAAGAGKAQGDVSDMAMAMKQSGLVAAQFGLSIEETVGTLTAFASAGLLGSDAGTSFRTMLLRMANPSKEAAAAMEELGIAAYDAQGNFVGMPALAEQLKTALEPLPQAQRDAAMATIFGSDAIRAANVLMKEGKSGIDGWVAAVDDQGYAAEVAAVRLDNLQGDLEKLSGSFETALIGMGSGANGPLRELVQGLTNVTDAFGKLPAGAQQATLGIVGGGGLVLLGIAGLGKLAVAVREVTTVLEAMGVSARLSSVARSLGSLAGYAGALTGVAAGVGMLVEQLKSGEAVAGANALERSVRALTATGDITRLNDAFSNFGTVLGMQVSSVDDFGSALDEVFDTDLNHKATAAFAWIPGVKSDTEAVRERFVNLDAAMAQMTSSGHAEEARQAFARMREEAVKQGYTMDQLRTLFPQYQDALVGAENAADDTAEAQGGLTGQLDATTGAVVEQVDALGDLVKGLSDAAGVVLDLHEAQQDLEDAYDNATAAIADNGATMDITTAAGRANQTALDNIAESGWGLVESMQANGATQEELQAAMTDTRAKFVEVATAMTGSSEEAERLADELGLIPTNIQPQVNVTTTGVAEAQAEVDRLVTRNNGRTITLNIKTGETTVSTGVGNMIARAEGGPITGPGGPTSDSVLALVSAGEYVISAAAVSKYGAGLFANLNARRYADGGQVAAWGATNYGNLAYATPSPTVSIDGARLTGSLDLGNGLVGVIDARVAQGIAATARSSAAVRATAGRAR